MKMLDPSQASETLGRAKTNELISEEDTTICFFARDILLDRMQRVKAAFPASAKHTVAVKANPLKAVLQDIADFGFGLEAASFEETYHASQAAPCIIAWDSPVKTDLEFQKSAGIKNLMVSCDNLGEVEMMKRNASPHEASLRINPQIKGSAHATMTVGDIYSKFGEPISNRENIISAALGYPNVRGLHVHVSSQTLNFSELCVGVRTVLDLANEINATEPGKIRFLDIGGGFPVDYFGTPVYDIELYVSALKEACPELFSDQYYIITEFGRYYHANAGFTATLISHVKLSGQGQTLLAHAGADLFMRECYQPGVWPHRFVLLNDDFAVLETEVVNTNVAGPLCFGGDYIQRNFPFHKTEGGNWVAILDTGANSVSHWSKHCSRAFPKCVQYDRDSMKVIRQRDTLERDLSYWGF